MNKNLKNLKNLKNGIRKKLKKNYQKRPSQVGKYVPLKRVCSKIPSTPPRACIISVR